MIDPTGRQHLSSSLPQPDRVLHHRLGVGRVLSRPAEFDDSVLVQFGPSIQEVRRDSLRWLVPLTVLCRAVQETGRVTAWSVRKANEQRIIRADAVGQFAGHRVHYYDVSRLPAVVEQLSPPESWTFGTLVIHSRFGPGKILANAQPPDQRLIQFFAASSPVSVSVQELRRLLPSHEIASRLQLDRKTFARQAARRGISPDYTAWRGRAQSFYDESRLDEIREQWSASGGSNVARFARLVSLRELARSEQMSRYKVSRLLKAMGVEPVYRDAKTFYFDRRKAHQAMHARLQREGAAVTLAMLSRRTGVSEAVLARKVRHGSIRTLDRHATHCVDAGEAAHVEQVVRALRSRSQSLEALSICRLHARGRAGSEVACWDMVRLLEVARALPSHHRRLLFDQVAWMCDGAGQKRLGQAFESYLPLLQNLAPGSDSRVCAKLLLELIHHLPSEFSRYTIRLLLLESGRMNIYRLLDERVRRFAAEAGCDDKRACDRFRKQIDHSLAELLDSSSLELADLSVGGDDECTPGAVIISVGGLKPAVGIISRVEQQCWNTLSRRWEKTTIVRFAEGEQRMNLYTRTVGSSLPLLLRSSEMLEIMRLIRRSDESIVRKAS